MNRTLLKTLLVKHEAIRLKAYPDTKGKLTIGVGRNLIDKGISADEAAMLLDNDINEVWHGLPTVIPGIRTLSDPRQHALIDMAFNLGLGGLHKFVKLRAAIERLDFASAAAEMLASEWAKDVGDRAVELAAMMKEG